MIRPLHAAPVIDGTESADFGPLCIAAAVSGVRPISQAASLASAEGCADYRLLYHSFEAVHEPRAAAGATSECREGVG